MADDRNIMEKSKACQEIRQRLNPVFKRNHIRKAILFGSYAREKYTEGSDVDILVDSGLHGLHFYGLLEDVCSALEQPVDLIDVYQLSPDSKIMQEIQKTGVVIYEST